MESKVQHESEEEGEITELGCDKGGNERGFLGNMRDQEQLSDQIDAALDVLIKLRKQVCSWSSFIL
jgi:hypothetical protein